MSRLIRSLRETLAGLLCGMPEPRHAPAHGHDGRRRGADGTVALTAGGGPTRELPGIAAGSAPDLPENRLPRP